MAQINPFLTMITKPITYHGISVENAEVRLHWHRVIHVSDGIYRVEACFGTYLSSDASEPVEIFTKDCGEMTEFTPSAVEAQYLVVIAEEDAKRAQAIADAEANTPTDPQ